MSSRNVSIDTTNYPTRSFSRTNRYTGTQYGSASTSEVSPVDNSMAPPSTKGEVSPVSPLYSTATTAPVVAAARPSFSAFDEIHLESPRELQPLGLGLTNANTSDAFRANFYRYNNIAPGTGLENLGNLSRSNSSSSNKSSNSRSSSRSSSHSIASSVSSTGLSEKPPAYVLEEYNVEKKSAWCSLSRWTPLMWLQLLFFLGVPTLTLSWIVSLLYFTLIPRLFSSKGKALNEWVLAGVERDTATGVQRQEGISLDGVDYIEVRKSMRRWEVGTAAAAGFVWTALCVVFGVIAVEFTRRGAQGVSYGNGDVGGDY